MGATAVAAPGTTTTPAVGSLPHARCEGGCSWYFKGRAALGDVRVVGIGCDDPHELVCRGCSRSILARCGTSRSSRCGPCGSAYRGRVGIVAGSGLRFSKTGFFVTLTAPGSVPHAMPDGRLCPCTPAGGADLARWNADAGKSFNRLVQEVRRSCRGCGRLPRPDRLGARRRRELGWE